MNARPGLVWLLAAAMAQSLARGAVAESEIALVSEGRSAFVIVHEPAAPASVRRGAEELQRYVERVTGAKLAITPGAAPQASPFIALGDTAAAREAGIRAGEVPLEGFRLVSRGGNLFIAGPDTPDGGMTPEGGFSTGTLNGVYTFLEDHLDVRWLLPGPSGDDVPTKATVAVPALDRTERPVFRYRQVFGAQKDRPAVQEWFARHKLGYSLRLEHNHNWHRVVPPEMYDQHPEWFAEVDGKRQRPGAQPTYKLETTNPALVQHFAQAVIEAFRRDPKLTVFSLSPTDFGGWSTSAESRALYDRDWHGRESITPLILKFYNDVARIVGREFPDRKLTGYVYARYLYPPSAGIPPLEPNLFLVVASSISYGYTLHRGAVREDWERLLTAWRAHTPKLAYYDLFNWLKGNSGALTPPAPEILAFAFPRLAEFGLQGVFVYGTAEWSQAAVNNYVLAKLCWNPKLDPHALCSEFYRRAYGTDPGEYIHQLFDLIEATVAKLYAADRRASFNVTPRYQQEVLAANYPKVEALYLTAQSLAGSATPSQRARLDFFGDNLALMQRQLRAAGFLPENKESPLYRTDAELQAKIGRVNPAFGVAFAPALKLDSPPKN